MEKQNIAVQAIISLGENDVQHERKKKPGIFAPIICIVDTGVIYYTHTTSLVSTIVDVCAQ